jgi:multidrug efflux system outer membrane protein
MRIIPLAQLLGGAIAAALLCGCANLAPAYVRPSAPVAAAWPAATAAAAPPAAATAPEQPGWRDVITDARLRKVVSLTLANNRDLRVAALNITKARAAYSEQNAALFPAVAASASSTRTHTSGVTSSTATAGLGFSSFELDFFGKNANLSAEALQSYLNMAETRRSTQLSLIAEVATAWLTLAADQGRLQLAQDTLGSRQASYDLQKQAHAFGGTSGLTLSQAQSEVDSARVDVATYRSRVAQDGNALTLLVGASVPASLLPSGADSNANVSMLVEVPAGLPSSVLQRRPDVLAAEHTLMSANADIGVARAAFFPGISLTASAGTASAGLGGLFSAGSGAWTFAPSLTLPVFNAGSNRAVLAQAQATRDIAVANYEKTLQTAFREVADALAQRAVMAEQLAAQASLVNSTSNSLTLSDALFRNGSSSYLDVLDSQRALYTARQTAITLQLAEQTNRLTLYKVLGGGSEEGGAD